MSTAWFLWQRGLRGPEPALLSRRGETSCSLDEYERKHKLCEPIRVEEGLTLAELAARHPAPTTGDA